MEYNRQDWREVVIHVKGMMMWMMETWHWLAVADEFRNLTCHEYVRNDDFLKSL